MFVTNKKNFFCKRCGFTVCGGCSYKKRRLSKDPKDKKLRVCDLCDVKLDNLQQSLLFEILNSLAEQSASIGEQLVERARKQLRQQRRDLKALISEQEAEGRVLEAAREKEQELNEKLRDEVQQVQAELAYLNFKN